MNKELLNNIAIWKIKMGDAIKDSNGNSVNNKLLDNHYLDSNIKRLFDIIISLIILFVSSPIMIVVGILVKLTSKGPLFYSWNIIGKGNTIVKSYKFRTMIKNAEEIEYDLRKKNLNEMENIYFKLKYDPRITFIGRYMRKFSLDELPSLLSVLKGDLSIVGPRPVRKHEYKQLNDLHKLRFLSRPGITSLWVVLGKNEINNFNDISNIDFYYLANANFLLDVKILFKTFPIVMLGRNY